MSSGLRFNEAYGAVSDVTRMLYLQPDTAGFAREQPLQHPPGEVWSYSSGTANILSRIVQDAAGSSAPSVARAKLFKPLGMTTAPIETDEDGTLVGSSYMYATARDWARYGQFLLQGGRLAGPRTAPRRLCRHDGHARRAPPAASTDTAWSGSGVPTPACPARIPTPPSAFPPTPSGWRATTAKASPSSPHANWSSCA